VLVFAVQACGRERELWKMKDWLSGEQPMLKGNDNVAKEKEPMLRLHASLPP